MNFIFKIIIFLFLYTCVSIIGFAQTDTLPDFSILRVEGTTQISWYNKYKQTVLINIQRSKEQDKNFITLHSISYPSEKTYKYVDKTAPNESYYYRIFILLKDNNYLFSKIKQPLYPGQNRNEEKNKIISETPFRTLPEKSNSSDKKLTDYKSITDESSKRTSSEIKKEEKSIPDVNMIKDTKNETKSALSKDYNSSGGEEIFLKIQPRNNKSTIIFASIYDLARLIPKPINKASKIWKASSLIYTGTDGNVIINLPDVLNKKYSVTFLKEEGRPLFIIPEIRQSPLIVDKSSFLKSGWYYFEIKENNQAIERNRFMINRNN